MQHIFIHLKVSLIKAIQNFVAVGFYFKVTTLVDEQSCPPVAEVRVVLQVGEQSKIEDR